MKTFQEFLEQDITAFLDSQVELDMQSKKRIVDEQENFLGFKDYEKEVKSALENKDYTKAKLIYKDAKKIYGKIARTSPKRKTLDLII
ncbi:MAG: hypothetical protein AB7V77_05810, partial [Candidatus Woesearchaeota archaeon]